MGFPLHRGKVKDGILTCELPAFTRAMISATGTQLTTRSRLPMLFIRDYDGFRRQHSYGVSLMPPCESSSQSVIEYPRSPLATRSDRSRPRRVITKTPNAFQQQRVNEAGEVVARYLSSGGQPKQLLSLLGKLLLREDRNFHTIEVIEAAFQQYELLQKTSAGVHVLVAATRYLQPLPLA